MLATGGSTLALINAASPGATAPIGWTVAFFVAAQLTAVTAGLALLQALVLRRAPMTPADAMLLARRNGCALVAAGVTMFSAGAARPGSRPPRSSSSPARRSSASRWSPCCAHGRSLAGSPARTHPPCGRRSRTSGASPASPCPRPQPTLLLVTTAVAAAAAFARDLGEHATAGGAFVTASVEAMAVVGCFAVFGAALGLRHAEHRQIPLTSRGASMRACNAMKPRAAIAAIVTGLVLATGIGAAATPPPPPPPIRHTNSPRSPA